MRSRILGIATTLMLATAGTIAAQDGTQLLPEPDESNTRVGSRGANFLEVGVGARAMALGGAFVALSEGVSSLYWNPAGIAQNPTFGAMVSYNNMYADIGIDHLFGGVTLPVGDVGAVGVGVTYLTSGEMVRTTENFPEGNDPNFGETFSWSSVAFSVSYARQVTDRLVLGFTGKFIQEGIEDANATFFGGDAGVQFRTGLIGTTIGASILHVGSSGTMGGPLLRRIALADSLPSVQTLQTLAIGFEAEDWSMPTTFHFSVLWDLVGSPDAVITPNEDNTVMLVTDITDGIDTAIQTRLGVEYGYRDLLFVRAGKFFANEADTGDFRGFGYGLSGGFGVKIPVGESFLRLDYAYTDRGVLDNIQVFALEYAR